MFQRYSVQISLWRLYFLHEGAMYSLSHDRTLIVKYNHPKTQICIRASKSIKSDRKNVIKMFFFLHVYLLYVLKQTFFLARDVNPARFACFVYHHFLMSCFFACTRFSNVVITCVTDYLVLPKKRYAQPIAWSDADRQMNYLKTPICICVSKSITSNRIKFIRMFFFLHVCTLYALKQTYFLARDANSARFACFVYHNFFCVMFLCMHEGFKCRHKLCD